MTDDADASLVYAGSAGRVGRIALVNTFLALITIGVYRFWGKTRLRQYLWGAVRFQGDSLEYTGRPIELFLGFLIAIGVLFPFGVLFGALDFYVTGLGGSSKRRSTSAIFLSSTSFSVSPYTVRAAIV